MSNYRVRQVLALSGIPERQLRFLVALATYLPDDTRQARVSFDTLMQTTGNSHNTVRRARRELETARRISSQPGNGRGHVTLWITHCLPEKGTNVAGTLPGQERVPTGGDKGYQPQVADQRNHDQGLKRSAKTAGGARDRPPAQTTPAPPPMTDILNAARCPHGALDGYCALCRINPATTMEAAR